MSRPRTFRTMMMRKNDPQLRELWFLRQSFRYTATKKEYSLIRNAIRERITELRRKDG